MATNFSNCDFKVEPKPPELQMDVINLNFVGEPPAPNNYDLADGPPEFYDLNKLTSITGNLVTIDGETYLQKKVVNKKSESMWYRIQYTRAIHKTKIKL